MLQYVTFCRRHERARNIIISVQWRTKIDVLHHQNLPKGKCRTLTVQQLIKLLIILFWKADPLVDVSSCKGEQQKTNESLHFCRFFPSWLRGKLKRWFSEAIRVSFYTLVNYVTIVSFFLKAIVLEAKQRIFLDELPAFFRYELM